MYLLCFDIGNTTVTAGIFKKDKLQKYWNIPSAPAKPSFFYLDKIRKNLNNINYNDIHGIAIGSVVPSLNSTFKTVSKELINKQPFFVNYINCGIPVLYRIKKQVGADRLANAVAGFQLFGGPLIIIDMGTAVTFDCISRKGEYLGGLIFPGIRTSARALNEFTARLPLVNLYCTNKAVGRTTHESIEAGLFLGYTGMLKFITQQLKKHLQCSRIIMTGGHSRIFAEKLNLQVIPELTLLGLKIIFENNSKPNYRGEK